MNKLNSFFENLSSKQAALIFLILGFILYANTLNHEYALDDAIVLTKNQFTKQGIKGIPDILKHDSFTGFFGKEKQLVEGGRYRPLSIITYAIEYELWQQKPFASHLINLLLYVLIAIAIYKLTLALFSQIFDTKTLTLLAFITSVVFIVHPIHTEAVSNIKGRDELLSLLFSLATFHTILIYLKKPKKILLFSVFLLFFLGLMSKENTITFVAIIPLSIYFFKKANNKSQIIAIAPLIVASILFLYIRYQVLGAMHTSGTEELMNNPFIDSSVNQKYATIIYTWLIYFKLLIFPHPLTFDYYPYHIPLVNLSNIWVILSISIALVLALISIAGLRKRSFISFCIIAFAASFSIVSNLVFPVGTFMNERFVFMPSFFWCLAIAFIFIRIYQTNKFLKYPVIVLFLSMITFYSIKTTARNKVWKNDFTLFTTDVKTSFNSAKSNCSAGGKLWEEAKVTTNPDKQNEYYKLSENYLRKAIEIHPNYVDAWLLLGNLLFDYKKDVPNSVSCYIEVIKRQAMNENAWSNSDIVLQSSDDRNLQLQIYTQLNEINQNRYMVNYRLGVLHGRYFNNIDKGIYFLEKAHKINPSKVDALKDLGTAYGIKGNAKLSYQYSLKALNLNKNDHQIYVNLGIAASKLGMQNEANLYFTEANKLKSNK